MKVKGVVTLFVKPVQHFLLAEIVFLAPLSVCFQDALAQTDLHISGPKAGFPIAIAQLCDAGSGTPYNVNIPDVINRDLSISGFFNVIPANSYIETPGKCLKPAEVKFSDWSVIGAEGLVRGEVKAVSGSMITVDMYLFDVIRQQAVVGKRYETEARDYARVAHRFANEIVGFFTGEKGIFGTQIAFTSKVGRFSELFVMELDGSNARQLTRDHGLVYSPNWSPRGDKIVYTSYKTRRPELYITSLDGDAQQLTRDGSLKLSTKFLPNGSSMIGSNSSAGASNVVMYDLRGAITRRLTDLSGIEVSPSPSPDGSSYAFCSNRSGNPQIYVSSMGGGDAHRISFTDSNYCTSPAWSPKGDKIAFVCRDAGFQLYITTPSGEHPTQLTFGGNNEDPSWSPDGRYLAFSTSMGRGGAKGIAILPLVTGVAKRLPSNRGEDNQPAWSPKID